MHLTSWTSRASALTLALAMFGGCAPQPASQPQAAGEPADEAPATRAAAEPQQLPIETSNQQAAAAKSASIADDQVQPATAVAPAPAVDATAKPELPTGPGALLPLEEAIDSGQIMPQPQFTEQHIKTCKVLVGDQFPKLELADVSGQSQNLADLLGEKLTVVVFCNSNLPTSLEELADLEKRYVREFGEQGLNVIGVNVNDKPEVAKELSEQSGAKFPELSDTAGQAFASVATAKLPRTYLLDASGKILWFDIEYSRTTRQQLLSAIRYSLAQK
jgi:peroxiredoxin